MDPHPDTPSEEEDARRLVEQLRSAPAESVIADVFSTLLTAAEVKLGRRDARLFIDLCNAVLEQTAGYVSDDLGSQVAKALGRLRLGQVSAESQRGTKRDPEPNDLGRVPTPPTTAGPAEARAGDRSTE